MAKKPEEVLEGISKKLLGLVKSYTKSKKFEQVAKYVDNAIRVRTRLGKGDDNKKFKELKASTKKKRKRYEKNLSEFTRPDKSNLTATGQMLDSIKSKTDGSKIIMGFKEKRTNELDGTPSKLTNSDVAIFSEQLGRLFFGLTPLQRKEFTRRLKAELLAFFRNN